jgi:glycosyltransferase involved in cell wall biosynthesis
MSKVKVSFIVPVYNVEQFLPCCLESISNQTVKDIEIICINDCSPDSSQSVLDNYAAKDSRVKLIEFKENRGPGPARNAGMDAASGEFLRMVDPDDFIPLESTEKLLQAAETHQSDFVKGGFRSCTGAGEILGEGWNHPTELVVNTTIKKDKRLWRFDQHWAYLYRTKVLQASGARYDESMRNGQDAAFLVELLPYFEQVTLIPETVYYYRKNPDSIMQRKRSKVFYFNVLSLYDRAYQRLDAIGTREAADYIFYLALCYYLPNNILSTIPDNLDHDDALEVLRYLHSILAKQNGKELCFNRTYPWQNAQQMSWQARYLTLMLCEGFLDDAYVDLKRIERDKTKQEDLQEKVKAYEDQLQALYASTSWKVTAILRKLGRMTRSNVGN